jgi:hypothetical protein
MPRLRELEGRFKRWESAIADKGHGRTLPDGSTQWGGFPIDTFVPVETLAEADGLWFDCPKCWQAWHDAGAKPEKLGETSYRPGVHSVLIWFEGRRAPPHIGLDSTGKCVRWAIGKDSTGLDDLVLTPSILLPGKGCGWHGFVGSNGVPPGHAA